MTTPFSLIAATFTPFTADGRLDLATVPRQVEHLVATGVDGAFVCGTTGEGASLTSAERASVTAAWTQSAPKGFRVIAHVGHASAHEARDLAAHAQDAGAAGIAAVAPYFLKPRNAAEAAAALAVIASGAPKLPFFYYHVPVATGIAIPAAAVAREARRCIPNFAGVKFTDTDLGDLGNVLDECGDPLEVFYGRDDMLLPALSLGVRRAVGMTYNYTGPLARRVVAAFDAGDFAAARAAQAPIRKLITASLPFGIIGALKAVAPALGVACGPARPPLPALSAAETEAVLAAAEIPAALAPASARRLAA